ITMIVTGEHLDEDADGITLATNSFVTIPYGNIFVLTACIILFAFSSFFSYCFYVQVNFAYIINSNNSPLNICNVDYIIMIVVGASVSLDTVVRFSDATFFLVAVPNLLGIYLLAKPLRKEIAGYRKSVAAGEVEPVAENERVNLMGSKSKVIENTERS